MSFFNAINKITKDYQLDNYNQFNIFKVMFKQHDERYLHSRFMAFLLDPKGSHKQGTRFLELFLKVMGIVNFSLDGVCVNPTELERGEVHNVDILIRNSLKQAIIFENKFFAKDQTKPDSAEIADEPLLKYQLTRYYFKIAIEEKYEVVKIIYLSIDGKKPEGFEKFPPVVRRLITTKDHLTDIVDWLDICLDQLASGSDLKRSIEQYRQARLEFLNDVKLALELKALTTSHFDEAKTFWLATNKDVDVKYHIVKNQFVHVKWHVVHEFYGMLSNVIRDTFKVEVEKIDNEKITRLTHHEKKIATFLTFNLEGVLYYVCNDASGFSIGRHIENKLAHDFEVLFENSYAFFDFTTNDVFELIKSEKRVEIVGKIVNQLKDFINKR